MNLFRLNLSHLKLTVTLIKVIEGVKLALISCVEIEQDLNLFVMDVKDSLIIVIIDQWAES